MPSVCFYFQVHQPVRLRHYTVFDENEHYFDDHKNGSICRKVANKCYLPANRLLLNRLSNTAVTEPEIDAEIPDWLAEQAPTADAEPTEPETELEMPDWLSETAQTEETPAASTETVE